MKERIRGYVEAMNTFNLSDNKCVNEIRFETPQKDIDNVFHNLLIQNKKADAVLFATNALSVSGLLCAQKNNILIPEDVAFIGFDGGDCFDLFRSPLTYVKQPLEEMGKEAFRVLFDLINKSSKTSYIMLNPSLVIRSST
jgi:LacI family transcriptional regulator